MRYQRLQTTQELYDGVLEMKSKLEYIVNSLNAKVAIIEKPLN